MGRSVSRPSNAQVVAYAHVENSYYCRTCAHCREDETYAEAGEDCARCRAKNRIPDVQFDESVTRMSWEADISNLTYALIAAFPSLRKCDRWIDREDHVILENSLAAVTVSEYCGLVAVCLVPERIRSGGGYGDVIEDDALARRWIASVELHFRRIVAETFGGELCHIGTFSNGEAVFKRA